MTILNSLVMSIEPNLGLQHFSKNLIEGVSPSKVVRLKYPTGEIKDRTLVEIDSIVADTWFPLE